ncbi:Hint domain-containing protein [Roseovarius sp. EL26]|uniref:Hint domain-containing protein n=1 Tax=Roseovarius sp. EL26 TaxID=2126672 RepID=UPI000EA374AF|nr:Hint domain-containing protein [Roseovarius sp. EL26]
MPDYTFNVYRITDIGGTVGLEFGGSVTVRDDDGFRDTILDDIEQAPPSETNGDQEIITSAVNELEAGDTIRARGINRFTNNETGETYDVTEIYSATAGNPTGQLFVFTSSAPDWLFDGTSRSFSGLNHDGTLPYTSIVCFSSGTLIKKGTGYDVPVENLKTGDHILTQDGSAQTLRWIGSKKVTSYDMMVNPKLRPICIKSGALGCNLPTIDLVVSRQHRILVRSAIAERIFGTNEVLIPAVKLINVEGIKIADDIQEIEYFHILFDQHQIIYSNGALTESLFTGPEALKAISPEARIEMTTRFPEIANPEFKPIPACRIVHRSKDVQHLLMRHVKNKKPLVANI